MLSLHQQWSETFLQRMGLRLPPAHLQPDHRAQGHSYGDRGEESGGQHGAPSSKVEGQGGLYRQVQAGSGLCAQHPKA